MQMFAGKHLIFQITLNDIKKMHLPESDDEVAKDMGYETPEALKTHLKEDIMRAKEAEVKKIQKAEILRQLLESHEFDLPETLIEQEISSLVVNAITQRGKSADNLNEQDIEALKNEMRSRAIRNVKTSVLLDAIGKKENVVVADDEVKNMIEFMSQRLSTSPENVMKLYVSKDGSLSGLRHTIYEDKVLSRVLSKASIEKGE
jgi:trigger factor